MTPKLDHVTIARDDDQYEAFPDVCRLRGDGLLCVYRRVGLPYGHYVAK